MIPTVFFIVPTLDLISLFVTFCYQCCCKDYCSTPSIISWFLLFLSTSCRFVRFSVSVHLSVSSITCIGESPPRCSACQVDLTIEHILLHCVSFTNVRNDLFSVSISCSSELFCKVTYRSIIDFIKETGFHRKEIRS